MPKILLIGSGAREHAIAETLKSSPQNPKIFSFMKYVNPGIKSLSEKIEIGNYSELFKIKEFAEENKVDFAFIGPEEPLSNGVVDALDDIDIPSVGPAKELAKLETSKSFTRNLLQKHKINASPKFRIFNSIEGINNFMDELESFVIKPDGLTGGKGVWVQGDHFQAKKEALNYCKSVLSSHSNVIIEEKLEGEEFSLMSFTDGKNLFDCPPVQDHKRAFENDTGPNTGGMGSYSCDNHLLPFLSKKDIAAAHEITAKVLDSINKETGMQYKGIMYGGFILTAKGVKLIEYNARLGDPEAMNVLPIFDGDFVDLSYRIIDGTLNKTAAKFKPLSTVCKYAVPKGYPDAPVKNQKIEIGKISENARVYYASVDEKPDGLYMAASRAVAFLGIAKTLDEAERIVEKAVNSVKGEVFHRKDIGTKELIEKRVRHMENLRG